MKKIKVRLIHSPAGRPPKQGETVRGLGLKKLYSEKVLVDSPEVRGMIKKIVHLVSVTEEVK